MNLVKSFNVKIDKLVNQKIVSESKEIVKALTAEDQRFKKRFDWFPLQQGGKPVRKCDNEGCPLYLRYNEDTKKYEHWKYDPNTKLGAFVQNNCDYYKGGS